MLQKKVHENIEFVLFTPNLCVDTDEAKLPMQYTRVSYHDTHTYVWL
jgi:hypothetical protein